VLPIAAPSDVTVDGLRDLGYDIRYRRFPGQHEVRPEIVRDAVRWFLRG
jgi:hypothetical protein